MTSVESALAAIVGYLEGYGTPYMVIGGLANLVWGTPRATVDVDVTVWVDENDMAAFVEGLVERFHVVPENPVSFIAETNVLPVDSPGGTRIDIIFGQLPFEKTAIARARLVDIAGVAARVCRPEDLILHKIVSERPQDLQDVRGIIQRHRGDLDKGYLDPRVRELASLIERPEMVELYLSCFS